MDLSKYDSGIKHICLINDDVRDDDLVSLKKYPLAGRIDLTGTLITDAGLQHLTGLTGLTALCLGRTRVTDAGLQHLVELKELRELGLFQTEVTDAGLETLQALGKLQRLSLLDNPRRDRTAAKGPSRLSDLGTVAAGGTLLQEVFVKGHPLERSAATVQLLLTYVRGLPDGLVSQASRPLQHRGIAEPHKVLVKMFDH